MPKAINFSWHDPANELLEAVFARGDRLLADVLEEAWRLGASLTAGMSTSHIEKWRKAFENTQVDPEFYAFREREEDEVLPWDHLSSGVEKTLPF